MAFKKDSFALLDLDLKDRKIMYELDVNSRQSNSAIAKKVSLNKNVVNYRINKLIERGIVKGFYAIIDNTKLGFQGVRFYLKFKYTTEEKEKEIIDFVTKSHLSWWVGSIDGAFDLGALLWVKDYFEFKSFWLELNEKFKPFIQNKLITIYTGLHHFSYAFINPNKVEPKTQFVGEKGYVKLSEADYSLLEVLAENARMPSIEIAKQTRLTPAIVKYSIKKLLKLGVIKGFRTQFNINALGYTYYKCDVNLEDIKVYNKLLGFVSSIPNTIYVDQTIGFGDFEPNFLVKSHSQFREIMAEMKKKFSKSIVDYSYMLYSSIHKIRYFQRHE